MTNQAEGLRFKRKSARIGPGRASRLTLPKEERTGLGLGRTLVAGRSRRGVLRRGVRRRRGFVRVLGPYPNSDTPRWFKQLSVWTGHAQPHSSRRDARRAGSAPTFRSSRKYACLPAFSRPDSPPTRAFGGSGLRTHRNLVTRHGRNQRYGYGVAPTYPDQ